MRGYADLVMGLLYGDEGKAKIIDYLMYQYNVSAKWNGSHNAGGTQERNGKKAVTNLMPAGTLNEDIELFIGIHCRINPTLMLKEINNIEKHGLKVKNRLLIDARTGLIQPHHPILDSVTGKDIGTTKKGVGYAYSDTCLRKINGLLKHISIGNFLHDKRYRDSLRDNLLESMIPELTIGSTTETEINDLLENYTEATQALEKNICYNPFYLDDIVENGGNVLLGGSNGPSLDPEYGFNPFTTSSRTLSKAAALGTGISNKYIRHKIGVMKAIQSRVGWGPFVGEFGGDKSQEYTLSENIIASGKLPDKEFEKEYLNLEELIGTQNEFMQGAYLRVKGNEYGATTGRCRRIAPLDLVEHAFNVRNNEIDLVVLNKLDCLSDFSQIGNGKIPITVGYKIDGQTVDSFPVIRKDYESIEPVIEYFPAFGDISQCKSYDELPMQAKEIIEFIQNKLKRPIIAVGTGPATDELILSNTFKEYF